MNLLFILNVFKARFKTSASVSFWAAFVLLLAGVLALGLIFNREDGLQIRVGVLEPQTERTSALLSHFKTYAERNCDILTYSDADQMKLDVSAGKLECAYVFDGEKITAYRSPQTVADKILDLMVAAVYTEGLAGELGAEVLEGLAGLGGESAGAADTGESEALVKRIQARADEYLKDGALMEMLYEEVNVGAETHAGNDEVDNTARVPYYRLFHGLTGLAGLLLALLCAMGLSGDAEKAAAVRLQARHVFSAAGFLIVFLLTFAFVLAAFFAGNLLYPGVIVSWAGELFTAIAFAFAVAGIAALLSALLPSDIFPAVISFVFIFAAVFGGAVFDIREVFEDAGPVMCLFPNYFFAAGNRLALLGIGLVCGAGSVWAGKRGHIKR